MTRLENIGTNILIVFLLFTLTYCQIAPQFSVTNPILGTVTSYRLSYYSSNNLTNSTTFGVSFNQSNLQIPDGINNCTIRISGNVVPSPSCNCVNKICTFRPMVVSNPGSVQVLIQNITNPLYMLQQNLHVSVFFNSSSSFNFSVIIPSSNYQPMSMIINSITQSDYGVGYTPVLYSFNISLFYISQNMQMQVTIPPQITFSSIISSLSFYNTIQNIAPMQVQSLLIFPLQVAANSNPNGFMLLNISGLGNPRFLGNSSSFRITFVETVAIAQCSTCKIAEITTGLNIQSRVPGDVLAVSLTSSSQYVGAVNVLSINLQLYAGIPRGGKVSIYLPPEISPTLPIQCNNIYGFTYTDSNPPICTYDSTSNRIDTVNFNTPYFYSTGNGIISIQIINPNDSRQVNFNFETYDNFSRMIGQSRSSSFFSAIPLPMNVSLSKTAQQVDTIFNMSGQISLTQPLNPSNNYIQVILPPVTYNTGSISCFSAGLNLKCNTSFDGLQQLYIKFAPPCVQCTTNSILRFTITNLKNPAYINDANQAVVVNTRSAQGIIQTSLFPVSLTPSTISLSSYTKPTNRIVGTQYDLQINLNLPDYVKVNGGQINVVFSPLSVYYDGQVTGFSYAGPSYSIQIFTGTSSVILTNSIQYNTSASPDSISRITFNVCDGTISVCSLSTNIYLFTIKKLKLGYIPSIQSTDTLSISTKYGQIISQRVIDTSTNAPIMSLGTLSITTSKSVTNSYSDFQFGFNNNQIVIDNVINFLLPASMIINGQCSLNNNQGFVTGFICTKINNNTIRIQSTFDQNLMISQNISFTIAITNVSTSTSTAPLNYQLFTTYNGTRNQVFSVTYAMQTPCPLNLTYAKTNYTINQQFILTFNITPVTLLYDSYQIIIPKTTIITQQIWLTFLTLTQNQTHYILTGTGYMTNNSTSIGGKNSLSTFNIPQYTLNLLQSGFLVQQSVITDTTNSPIVLGCNITTTNRTVSILTNLTITCDRNHNGQLGDQSLIVQLPTNSFDYSSARVNGVAVNTTNPTATISLTLTLPRIVNITITSVKNLLYIPNLNSPAYTPSNSISPIQVSTISTNITAIIGQASISPSFYIANDGYDIKNTTAVRNNVKCGNLTNITINYNTILGTSQHVMQITLPTGQNQFIAGTTGCYIGVNPCNIVDINNTDIKIIMVPNSIFVLTNVTNLFPNLNSLSIKIYTYPQLQLVQQSVNIITPPIALQPLQLTARPLTTKIGELNTLSFFVTPTQLKIQTTNTVIITVPTGLFTRTFNNDDCVIRPSGSSNNFTGCTYNYDRNGWLVTITIGTIGPFDVEINNTLGITIGVTNGWGAYPFSGKSFVVTVYNSLNSGTSQGSINVGDVFTNLSTFSLIPINQQLSTFVQSSLLASSSNIITINLSLNGNIGRSARILCLLPKDSYTFMSNNAAWQLQQQDSSYYYISIATNCTTNGCQLYSQSITINISNSYFIKKQRNNIILYTIYDGLAISDSYIIVVSSYVPLSIPNLGLARTSNIGSDLTNVSITFNMLPSLGSNFIGQLSFGQVQIDISNNITSPVFTGSAYSYSQQNPTSQSVLQIPNISITKNSQNITTLIPATVSNSTNTHRIVIKGKNPLEVPTYPQRYWMTIQNGTHILYISYGIGFTNSMIPLSTGLNLVRSNTTAVAISQLRLQGALPTQQIINMGLYPVTINGQNFPTINQSSSISLPLYSYANPSSIYNQSTLSISLCSATACIYRQNNSPITPVLTPIQYDSDEINWAIPATMNINTQYTMTINLTTPVIGKNFVNVAVDDRLVAAFTAVNVYQYNSVNRNVISYPNINYTVNTINSATGPQKIVTIRPSISGTTINISSTSLTFTSVAYQTTLTSSTQSLFIQLPSTTYTKVLNFTIISPTILTNLTSTSNKTNQIANYTLTILPILRTGLLTIQLPNFISNLFNGGTPNNYTDDTMNSHLIVKINGTLVSINGTRNQEIGGEIVNGLYLLDYNTTSNQFIINIILNQSTISTPKIIQLTLTLIQNPNSNIPFAFTIIQHEVEIIPTLIYGYNKLQYRMTNLNPITVYSGIRNITKIGSRVSVTFDIQTQSNSSPDVMVIKMSAMQVTVTTTNDNVNNYPCQVCIDGINCGKEGLTITVIEGTNSIQLSPHRPGRHNYTISGCLINSLFSQQPHDGDQIYVSLTQPYQTAQSTPRTSTYITPLVSTGQIQIISQTSSSNKRADYTTLSLTIKPQNYRNCDGILLSYSPLAYYIHQNIKCFINSHSASYYVINSSALFIKVENLNNPIITIQIKNMINYIQNNGFTINTLKQKIAESVTSNQGMLTESTIQFDPSKYGIADQIVMKSASNGFIAYSAQTRIVFPDNYASTQPKNIIAVNDFSLPAELPISTLRYSFSSSLPGCSKDLPFNKSISMSCTLSSSRSANFSIKLYDTKLASMPLTSFSKSIYVYPQPKQHCSNTLCDVCSTGQTGNQYCFVCRQGLFSSQGKCVEKCPAQKFAFNKKTCTQCSPECSQCFDLYDNSCLSCKNTNLVLDSGFCRDHCTTGYSYQALYCVNNEQCSIQKGCRLCSQTGFCYQCLPDYKGEPNCQYAQIIPKNFFIFWMIPFILLLPIVGIITCVKVGRVSFSHMLIFLLSVIQLISWILVIPKMPQQALAMVMCSFLLLKIIISIIAYETYYNKQITLGKQQKLLADQRQSQQKTDNIQGNSKKSKDMVKNQQQNGQQKITHKQRLTRFIAHFTSCDAYQLLMNKLGKPYMTIKHFMPYFVLTMLNRLIVIVFLIYVMSQSNSSGDLLYLPLIAIISGLGIGLTRLATSDKAAACLSKIKG